jgi:predicted dehydrogenase
MTSSFQTKTNKIRYAVVGLGWFSQSAALPAFAHAKDSELVALVSGDEEKLKSLGSENNIKNLYSYDQYEECLRSGLIDAVYIGLPNHLHKEYTVKAAEAGIHVLCEKPMALNKAECEEMIKACESANVKLMIAYRLHLEKANLSAIKTIQSGKLGNPRIFNSVFSMQVEEGNVRLEKSKGGGTLEDIGIYCINASRYLFQQEPIEVFATSATNNEKRFDSVPEMTSVIMRFPEDKLASFTCSFGVAKTAVYTVDSAYSTEGEITHTLVIDGKSETQTFEPHDQIAAEFSYFSNCILQNEEVQPSGYEGLADVAIIECLNQSIKLKSFVKTNLPKIERRPSLEQVVEEPKSSENPELVNASSPS